MHAFAGDCTYMYAYSCPEYVDDCHVTGLTFGSQVPTHCKLKRASPATLTPHEKDCNLSKDKRMTVVVFENGLTSA